MATSQGRKKVPNALQRHSKTNIVLLHKHRIGAVGVDDAAQVTAPLRFLKAASHSKAKGFTMNTLDFLKANASAIKKAVYTRENLFNTIV